MFLVRLLYCSTPASIGDDDIAAILDVSRANNVFNGTHFLQCLEGGRGAVSKRFISIANDKRHHNVEILEFVPIAERRFAQWTMQYVGRTDLDQGIVSTYTAGVFDPRHMAFPGAIVDMLWRLAQ